MFESLKEEVFHCFELIFQPDVIASYEEVKWDTKLNCLVDVDEYNMTKIHLKFDHGILDKFEVPEDKE